MVYSLITFPNQQRVPKKMEQEKKIRREIANSNERRRMQSINAGFNSLRTMLPKHDNEKLSKAAILQHTAEYIDQLEQDKTRFLQEIRDIKKLLNPELLELHQKSLQEQESKLIDKQPYKRIKLEAVNNSLDLSNSESSDEGIQLGNLSPKHENKQQSINQQPMNEDQSSNVESLNIIHNHVTNNCLNNLTSNQLINGGSKTNDVVIDSDDIDVLRAELVEVRKVLDRERRLRMKLEENVRELEAQLYPSRIKEIAHQVQLQFQVPGINMFTQPQIIQIKDADTETLMIDPQHEVVAQTVEIGPEIEDCTEFTNHSTILTSSNQNQSNFNNHHIALSNKQSSNVNLPSTFLIQDLSNHNLIDSANHLAQHNLSDKIIEIGDEMSNKILTSAAYLTTVTTTTVASTNCTTVTSKATKSSKSNTSKTDKNVQNKKTNNSCLTTSNQQQNFSTPTQHNDNKNKQTNSSVTTLSDQTQSNQSQQDSSKKDKVKKTKTNQPAAIALPIDVPFIIDATNSNLEMNANKLIDQSLVPTTVTVQIIDGTLTTTTDEFESTPAVITASATTAGRNNNLDTILEAICHLEGDMFGNDKEMQSVEQLTEQEFQIDQNGTIKQEHNSRPGVIVSSSNP